MSIRSQLYFGLALTCLTGQAVLAADDPPQSRPAPIVFSAPKSDTVSSNLNQIGTKSSPLSDLESGLTKPFEIFDSGRASGGYQPPNRFAPPAPSAPINNKKMKDALDKRAEESYLLSEDHDSERSKDDLMNTDRDSVDPITGRPKSSLDRYYDRIDRLRAGPTNQTSRSLDLFGEKDKSNDKDDLKPRKSGGLFDRELSGNARGLGQMTNNSEGGRLFSEKLKPRSNGDIFELGPVEPADQTARTKETRLTEFKRLLDGPSYGARSEFNVAPPSSSTSFQAPKSIVAAPGSSLSVGSQSGGSSFASTPGFSGAVGVPVGVPEYAASSPSLTTVPTVQQPASKPVVPKFEIPRRRF